MSFPTPTAAPQGTGSNIDEKNRHLFTPQGEKADRCLIEHVRTMLLAVGLGAQLASFDNNTYVIQAKGLPEEGQRFLLTRFWNMQLLINPARTQEARYYLQGTVDPTHWLDVFRLMVVPLCQELSLPRPVGALVH